MSQPISSQINMFCSSFNLGGILRKLGFVRANVRWYGSFKEADRQAVQYQVEIDISLTTFIIWCCKKRAFHRDYIKSLTHPICDRTFYCSARKLFKFVFFSPFTLGDIFMLGPKLRRTGKFVAANADFGRIALKYTKRAAHKRTEQK